MVIRRRSIDRFCPRFFAAVTVACVVTSGGLSWAQTGVIDGVVVTRELGQAVPDATVTVEGTNLTTRVNAIGRFRIGNIPAGARVIVVEAPGFLPLRVPGLEVGANQVRQLELELERTPNLLERVQVTATKSGTPVGTLAAPATILDAGEIARKGDLELTQALENVPGVIISGQLGPFESVLMRGLPRDGNEFETTLLLVDGVPQTDSRNAARVINLPIHDAGAVEIIRGPNSALYGRTAVGGSINILTAGPTPSPEFSAELTGGGFGTFRGVATASGPLSDWGGYYVSLSSYRDHGYWENDLDFGVDETSQFGKLTFVPDERSFGSISLNRVVSDNSTATNEPILQDATGELRLLSEIDPDFERLTNLNVPGTNYHQEETRATLNYTREMASWIRFTEIFGYRKIQYKFIDDGDFIGAPYDLATQTLSMYPFSQQTDEDIFYQELRFDLTPRLADDLPSSLVAGGSYEHNSGFNLGDLIFTDPDLFGFPINWANPVIPPREQWEFFRFGGRDYDLGSTGLFAQYTIEPGRWVFQGGGRYDHFSLDNTRTLDPGRPGFRESFDAFSPKASATYKLFGADGAGPAVNIYGAWSEAFRPPRKPSDLSASTELEPLDPEDIRNYEAGVKASLFDDRLALEGNYFWMNREGIVISIREGAFFVDSNAGEHEYKGFELGARTGLSDRVSLFANVALYRNRFGDFVIQEESGDTVLTGNRINMSPDYVVNWGAAYSPTPDVDASFDVKHVGDSFVDVGNTFRFDPYTIVDAAVSWQSGPVRFTLSATNLFDEEYYWGGGSSAVEVADPGRPRQVLLTTSFSFR